MSDAFYNDGSRSLQDRFETRQLADRLTNVTLHHRLTDDDRVLIESATMFFLATADALGHPDCSYKGGDAGFVRVVDPGTLVFPSYDGNGMFRSVGNIVVNPWIGMLFIDFERPRRLRVNGRATVHHEHPWLERFPEADLLVEVAVEDAFPNCPRYIHKLGAREPSPYVPREGCETPRPKWKDMDAFRDALAPRDRR